jgi:hypothetical protein
MAEIELHILNSQCLNRHIGDLKTIMDEVEAWQKSKNSQDKKINWQFTTQDSRIKLKRLYPSFNT